jgi:hypothetical protein
MVLRGGLPGNFVGRADSAGHAGWSQTQLVPTDGKEVIDIPMVCGETDFKYFGEELVHYKTQTPCQCQQLCTDHIDEGCQAWQWYGELRQCTLLKTVFHPDGRTWFASTTTEHRTPGGPPGWWRKQKKYPGWVTGLAGPLTVGLERTDRGGSFDVTIKGVGFPSASTAHAQRIKILLEHQDCVHDVPPEDVRGNACSNKFACSPGPSEASLNHVTFEGFELLHRKTDSRFKVCWCPGDCALAEYWHTVPAFLEVPAAPLVWTAESPFGFGELGITVSRPPFHTYSSNDMWRIRIVRAELDCRYKSAKSICGGNDCPAGNATGADLVEFKVSVDFDIPTAAYLVCVAEDGVNFRPVPSATKQYITLLGGPPEVSMAPFTQQRFTARDGEMVSFVLPGGVLYPTQSALAVVDGKDCSGSVLFFLQGGMDFSGMVFAAAGEYRLCYCDSTTDKSLDVDRSGVYPSDANYTWRVERYMEGSSIIDIPHGDRCTTKCAIGCVGPDCYCDTFIELREAERPGIELALCLPPVACRQLCEETEECSGYTTHIDKQLCWINTEPDVIIIPADNFTNATEITPPLTEISADTFFWHPETGASCTDVHDFVEGANIGALTVTRRVDVGVDFVITPDEPFTLELTGADLHETDQLLVIPQFEKCGYTPKSHDEFAALLSAKELWAEEATPILRFDAMHSKVLSGSRAPEDGFPAGTFTLCFCDVESKPCRQPSDFIARVGTIHASGISCMFGAGGSTKSCLPMEFGGYRCYDGDAPSNDYPRFTGFDYTPFPTPSPVSAPTPVPTRGMTP